MADAKAETGMYEDPGEAAAANAALATGLRDLQGLAEGFGRAMTSALRRAASDGRRLESVLKSLALSLSGRALGAALAPVGRGLGDLLAQALGGLGGARLAAGAAPRVTPFAAGGIVARPSFFPLGDGAGVLGEAGPEAILPLARGPDGRLGVRAGGMRGGVNVTFNVTARDADSFRRAEADLTAMLARAVARGQRGL